MNSSSAGSWSLITCLVLISIPTPLPAASTLYSGTYVIIDPYSPSDRSNLKNASAVNCATQSPIATPFCGTTALSQSISGIFLQIDWCNYEFYEDGTSNPPPSCRYYTQTLNSHDKGDLANTDVLSPCQAPGTPPATANVYDDCVGSSLDDVLGYIVKLNANRAQSGINLPQLKLSLGIVAGAYAPLNYVLSSTANDVSTVDFPIQPGVNNNFCVRLPTPWSPTYIVGYENALSHLITHIQNYIASPSLAKTITIVKVSPINLMSNEFDEGGRDYFVAGSPDSSQTILGQGSALHCPTATEGTVGAQLWLNVYNVHQRNTSLTYPAAYPDCRGYNRIAQANECVYGLVSGYIFNTLIADHLNAAIVSTPTNGKDALPDIGCGVSGIGLCNVQGGGPTTTSDNWSIYYFYQYVIDLFTPGTVANSALLWSFPGFSPSNSKLVVNTTALQLASTPINNYFTDLGNTKANSYDQIGCALNNQVAADQPQLTLNGQSYGNGTTHSLPGVPATGGATTAGTVIGWQTQTGQGSMCATVPPGSTVRPGSSELMNDYDYVLASGFLNGGLFIEVQPDVAFLSNSSMVAPVFNFTGYLDDCANALTYATQNLRQNTSAPGICAYNPAQQPPPP